MLVIHILQCLSKFDIGFVKPEIGLLYLSRFRNNWCVLSIWLAMVGGERGNWGSNCFCMYEESIAVC